MALNGEESEVEYKYQGKIRKKSIQKSIIRLSSRLKKNQKQML